VALLKRSVKLIIATPLNLQRAFLVIYSLFVASLMVIVVICRYFLQIPVMWFEEIILYSVFWFYLLGASYATYERSHISGGVVNQLLKEHPKVLAGINAGAALFCTSLSALMTSWAYTNFMWNLQTNSRSTQLFLPLAYSVLSLPVGFILMAIYFLVEFISLIPRLATKKPSDPSARGVQ